MLYRRFGKTGKTLSGLGWGTNRFAPADLQSQEGLERIAELIAEGVRQGINYIDCGHTYAMGKAEKIVSMALEKIARDGNRCYTSVKVMYQEDPTAEQARRRIENSMNAMRIRRAAFGFAWRVSSYEEFLKIIQPGGLYEGLAKARAEGLIEHICFSSHASAEDTIKIIESEYFEGCMLSCNILNVHTYGRVFDAIRKHDIGAFSMNSLGGGVIPRIRELAAGFPDGVQPERVAGMALKELYSHEELTSCLSAMQNTEELRENLTAFREKAVPCFTRPGTFPQFCTKCRYCKDCPKNLPVSDIMYAYNNLVFSDLTTGYGKYDPKSVEQLFNPRFCDYNAIPESEVNPCIRCGRCEKRCTQGLPIMESIQRFYDAAARGNYTRQQRKQRLIEKIQRNGYKSVCFYPAGNYTRYVVEEYWKLFGTFPDELYVCDSSERLWGQELVTDCGRVQIVSPEELRRRKPELVLVTNFFYGEEIYRQLSEDSLFPKKTRLEKLHEAGDIPWY